MDGKWYAVYRDMAVNFAQDVIVVEPHTALTRTYDIGMYTDSIPAGQYRVLSVTHVPAGGNLYLYEFLIGEFVIQ